MSAVLETYFQHVVVDKLNKTLSKQFEEMKDALQILKKLQSDYTFLRIEIESLKKRVSDSSNEIKEMLSKDETKATATKKPTPAKITTKKPTTQKLTVKKKATSKKTAK
ncbi:hypothetical protein SCALIN_C17_0089 [Candidatus Scalindua japonica]|uniref:Uncharacterized protein n=1 Tax=Candidatus Scalindua japonica TaxID=1284222 RepID=A0A286TYV9_9BACT|nr:hypothetical protein [Candidatus Scalindua japonica]GAX61056.1 hypothetical protein SCALIN_C17_0089 [Candidatus Scalindua japonica]